MAGGERLTYRAVRENHAPQTIVCSSHRGCSSMVERQLPKLDTRVRFPSPALRRVPVQGWFLSGGAIRSGSDFRGRAPNVPPTVQRVCAASDRFMGMSGSWT